MNKRSYALHGHEGPVLAGRPDHKWVYLWHWPIRAMHWIAALCIVALAVTGFFIGKPYFMTGGEATPRFAMGWMRFLHFTAAGLLVATGIVRAYWLLMGNKFERWTALFPVRRRDLVNMFRMTKFYLMIKPEKAPHYLGHNPMQQMSYTGMYALAALQVVTGFAMYGLASPGSVLANMFGWINPLLGGEQIVRFVHHVITWLFIAFIPIHVYLALRADLIERSGTVSSIISGGRFVPAGLHYEDE
jgi:Ni/Fe-hydrogenase 1 B-type cytochrome subunit